MKIIALIGTVAGFCLLLMVGLGWIGIINEKLDGPKSVEKIVWFFIGILFIIFLIGSWIFMIGDLF